MMVVIQTTAWVNQKTRNRLHEITRTWLSKMWSKSAEVNSKHTLNQTNFKRISWPYSNQKTSFSMSTRAEPSTFSTKKWGWPSSSYSKIWQAAPTQPPSWTSHSTMSKSTSSTDRRLTSICTSWQSSSKKKRKCSWARRWRNTCSSKYTVPVINECPRNIQ